MRLNASNGAALTGVTFGIAVDGVSVPGSVATWNLPRWFDAATDVVVFHDFTAFPPTALLKTVTLPATVATVDTSGANELGGGGGVWVAFLSGAGVRTSISGVGPYPNAGLCDVDDVGNYALVQNRAEGRGIVCFNASGTQTAKWDVVLSIPAVPIRNGVIAYCDDTSVWHLRDVTTGDTLPIANRTDEVPSALVPVTVGAAIYVLEQLNTRITLRLATGDKEWTIAAAPAFNSDVVWLSGTTVRIGWSVGAGEAATELRLLDLTVTSGANETGTAAGGGGVIFTPGTSLSAATVPVSAVIGGGSGSRDLLNMLRTDQPFVDVRDTKGYLTPPWHKTLAKRFALDAEAIDLASQTTGTLPPESGGGPGSVLIAENLIGTVPQAAKWRQFDTALTGSQNDLIFTDADFIHASNASALTITGLMAGVPGQRLVVVATDAEVTLQHQSASSTAANRVLSFSGADVTLASDQAALLEYDGTDDRWRLLLVTDSTTSASGYWAPLTDGDLVETDLIFADGECVMVFVPV